MERILEDVSYIAGDSEGELGPGAECAAAPQPYPPHTQFRARARLPMLLGVTYAWTELQVAVS